MTDKEMLQLLRIAYFDLVSAVLRIHDELLGEDGERYDGDLENVALAGPGRAVKVGGFRRSLGRVLQNVPGLRWIKKAFEWGNIILGSLGGVPVVGVVADPIRELKESIEAQGDDDQSPRSGVIPRSAGSAEPAHSIRTPAGAPRGHRRPKPQLVDNRASIPSQKVFVCRGCSMVVIQSCHS